eukprot:9807211-Heterocapsa_arctica.AAC.1
MAAMINSTMAALRVEMQSSRRGRSPSRRSVRLPDDEEEEEYYDDKDEEWEEDGTETVTYTIADG